MHISKVFWWLKIMFFGYKVWILTKMNFRTSSLFLVIFINPYILATCGAIAVYTAIWSSILTHLYQKIWFFWSKWKQKLIASNDLKLCKVMSNSFKDIKQLSIIVIFGQICPVSSLTTQSKSRKILFWKSNKLI